MGRKSRKKKEEFMDDGLDDFLKKLKENKNKAISTGLKKVDEVLDGGLNTGLYILGGMPSFGKTAFIYQIGDYIAQQNQDVIFFSLEMGKNELLARSLSRKIFLIHPTLSRNIGTRKIMRKEYDEEVMKKAIEDYKSNIVRKMTIVEGNENTSVKEIREKVEKHIKGRGRKPVIFVDFLQIIRPTDFKMTDKEKNDYNILGLKRIARDFDIPVVIVSSVDRYSYFKQAAYENFKDTENIEYIGDVILYLQYRNFVEEFKNKSEYEKKEKGNELKEKYPRKLEMIVLKDRSGKPYNVAHLYYYPINHYFSDERIGK